MSFANRLIHSLLIVRHTVQTDVNGDPLLDENGMPLTTDSTTAVKGLVQPKSAREVALISQGGAVVSDHTIYMLPTDITAADLITFDPDDGRAYEIRGVRDAAGIGHHLEIDARMVA
jgi:hypothetical protein